MAALRVNPERLARAAEEAALRVLERYLGSTYSSYLLAVKVEVDGEGLATVAVDLEVLKGPPGVDLEAVVEEAVEAARREVDRHVRSLIGGRGAVEGEDVRGGYP